MRNHSPASLLLLSLALLCALPSRVLADGSACDGPPECCPKEQADRLAHKVTVAVGIGILGLYSVDDKSQSWDADYHLYEAWTPEPGFTPQTEVVNEINRLSSQFDETVLHHGRCIRSRRLHSTLHSHYNLRLFPFDRQQLIIKLADAERDSEEVSYAATAYSLAIDDEVRDELPSWTLAAAPTYQVKKHAFSFEPGSPNYDVAVVSIPVIRNVSFYLTRLFLPLLLIVVVAFAVFWIHPEDLGSQVGIGVTCLLAVIAFQFGETSTLPVVEYLTLADRVYATCYFLITLSLVESVYTNTLSRRGEHEKAARVDRLARIGFPLVALLLCISSLLLAIQGRH